MFLIGCKVTVEKWLCGAQGFAISEDEGTTFAIRTVPGTSSGNNDPSVGVGRGDKVKTATGGPAGRVYFGYSEGGRPKIATSGISQQEEHLFRRISAKSFLNKYMGVICTSHFRVT